MIDSYYAGNGEFYTTREMYQYFRRNVRVLLKSDDSTTKGRYMSAYNNACLWQRRLFAHTGQWVEYQTAD